MNLMNDPDEMRRQAHLARRGQKGLSNTKQRVFDLLKRDKSQWFVDPSNPDHGMWCPEGWYPDWERNYPVFNVEVPKSRV